MARLTAALRVLQLDGSAPPPATTTNPTNPTANPNTTTTAVSAERLAAKRRQHLPLTPRGAQAAAAPLRPPTEEVGAPARLDLLFVARGFAINSARDGQQKRPQGDERR